MRTIQCEYSNLEEYLKESSLSEEEKNLFIENDQEQGYIRGVHNNQTVFWVAIFRKGKESGEVFLDLIDKSFVNAPDVIRGLLDHAAVWHNYKQIYATALASSLTNNRFLKWLGFTYKASMIEPDGNEYNQYSLQ